MPNKEKFSWGTDVARSPKTDSARPEAKLSQATQKSKLKTPKPTSDLPTKLNGQLDNVQLKSDLVSQLKSQRKRN